MKDSTAAKILFVDDEEKLRSLTVKFLEQQGFEVRGAANAEAARDLILQEEFDAVISDLRMPGMGGLGLLQWIQDSGPPLPVLVVSAYGDVSDAVKAMKLGARDYVVKPFEADELEIRLRNLLRSSRLEKSVNHAQPAAQAQVYIDSDNKAMQELLALTRRAAPSAASILIGGESGTGKEVLAKWIHALSDRASAPFIPLNLGGIPDTLIESELFGYEKGAFTGAERRKPGYFELAGGGTLFLDEIGDMPMHLQVKLLRVLQDRKVQRLGSTAAFPIDVRVIAATHRDLGAAVKAGTFREDLFYRLNVISVRIPPLRERLEDLPALVALLVKKHAQRNRGSVGNAVSPQALEALRGYAFPGNIRELENMVERALILGEGPQLMPRDFGLPGDLPPGAAPKPTSTPTSPSQGLSPVVSADGLESLTSLDAIEKWAILRALERHEGKRAVVANELGISRRTLLNKIKEYGIEVDADDQEALDP